MIDYEIEIEKKFVESVWNPTTEEWWVSSCRIQVCVTFSDLDAVGGDMIFYRLHKYSHGHWVTHLQRGSSPNVLRVTLSATDGLEAKLAFHSVLNAYMVGEIY